jgi:hypothetical protein
VTVACDLHGPMKWREGPGWWECFGFDGEGCGVQIVYEEDARLGPASGIPGVTVLTKANAVPAIAVPSEGTPGPGCQPFPQAWPAPLYRLRIPQAQHPSGC